MSAPKYVCVPNMKKHTVFCTLLANTLFHCGDKKAYYIRGADFSSGCMYGRSKKDRDIWFEFANKFIAPRIKTLFCFAYDLLDRLYDIGGRLYKALAKH